MTELAPATPSADPSPAAPEPGTAPAAAALSDGATPASPDSWLTGLPDDLQADPTLSKYKSLEDMARGHLETKKTASIKSVPLPGDSDESRKAFADALRPENIDAYDFGEQPEFMDQGLVDKFREFSLENGLPPFMAKGAMDFYASALGEQVEQANAASAKEVAEYKQAYGNNYDSKLADVQKMLESFTGGPLDLGEGDLNQLDMKLGSSKLLEFMFAIHDRVGDLSYAGDGATPSGFAGVAPENAEATLKTKFQDADWRAKAQISGSPEHKENERLQKLLAQHRTAQGRG